MILAKRIAADQPRAVAIVYHDADMDGRLSMEIADRLCAGLGAAWKTFGWDYGRELPDVRSFDFVLLLDLSIPQWLDDPAMRQKLFWVDHHKSAIERWPSDDIAGLRMEGVAACRLTWTVSHGRPATWWDYFERRVSEPALVTLVGEHDVWNHVHASSLQCHYGLGSLDQEDLARVIDEQLAPHLTTTDTWARLEWVLERGGIVQAYHATTAALSARDAATVNWRGIRWCFLTGGGNSVKFNGAVRPEHEGLLLARYDGRLQKFRVSLYQPSGTEGPPRADILEVARSMGGGGHQGACGFQAGPDWLTEFLAGVQP